MSSFLNKKNQIFDFKLTNEAKRQLANGQFDFSFYSFSDGNAVYDKQDPYLSSSNELGHKLQFSVTNLLRDAITIESNEYGQLNLKQLSNGQIINGTFVDRNLLNSGSANITSSIESITSSSISNFQNLRILGPKDPFELESTNFKVSNQNIVFNITTNNPLQPHSHQVNLNQVDSLFADKRLSHINNFKYLPPINKKRNNQDNRLIGDYVNLNQQSVLEFRQLDQDLQLLRNNGNCIKIKFDETSKNNRIFGQFFEFSTINALKLSIIDFGIFSINDVNKHVFFIGKLFEDDRLQLTFINIFTLVFKDKEENGN